MSNVKHTPGPWRAQRTAGRQMAIDRKWEIVHPEDRGESVIVGEHTGIDCLTEANARLIAAAPAMKDALTHIATIADAVALTFPNAPGRGDVILLAAAARAAIAKAEGRV